MNADLARRVLPRWDLDSAIATVEPMLPGFSGASVFRCSDKFERCYALKRWPGGTSTERVRWVHGVITAARAAGCDLLPRLYVARTGSTVVVDDGCWELAEWISGEPLPRAASMNQVAEGAAAIARFHRATLMTRQSSDPSRCVSPSVVARLKRLHELDRELPRALAGRVPPDVGMKLESELSRAAELLRRQWSARHADLSRQLHRWSNSPVAVQAVLRDVHRDHVLFSPNTAGQLVARAIIDFDAVRADGPGVDLARWVASFRESSLIAADRLHQSVAGYRAQWQLNNDQVALAETLLNVSMWVNLANWVVWLVLGTRTFVNDELAIASRISEISDQVSDSLIGDD